MGGKITDDELEMLSDEEREALKEEDTRTPEEIAAAEAAAAEEKAKADAEAKVAAEANMTEEEREAKQAEDDRIEEEAKAKAKADADAAAKVQVDKEAADLEAAQKAEAAAKAAAVIAPKVEPAFVLESKSQHGTIAEIEAKMTALDTKFEDGDITLAAYNKERAGYVEAITEQKMFATINAQVQKAAAEKGWKDAQADFFKDNPEYSNERAKNLVFVDAVNRLLATDESKKMTDAQVFEAAKKECDAVFYPTGRQKPDDKAAADAAAAAEVKRKAIEAAKKAEADRAAGVKTLARVPVSEGNQGDDKYDAIDKLTGEAYENAVAKMSDAERAQYAART